MKKSVLKIGFTFLLSLSLMGCSSENNSTADSDSATSSSESEKVINMMEINEISSMDSGNALDGGSFIAITQVIEGLYNLDAEDNIIPGVATDLPEISSDGLTYTVPLRDNAYWSNGEQVTAHDFVFAWQKVVDPAFASASSFLLSDIKNATKILDGELDKSELGVRAVDDYTLEVTLEQPVAYFTSVMTFPTLFPQNEEYVTEQGDQYATDSDHLIYNGPYQLDNWSGTGETWSYVKNDSYWNKEQSNVETVNIQVVKDTNLAVNMYETGTLDRAVLSGEYARQFKDDADYTTQLDSWVHVIELNQKRPDSATIFTNQAARQAIGLAIDRNHIVDDLLNNGSQTIYGLVPAEFVKNPESGEDFREESGDPQGFDAEKATALWEQALSEAGLTEVTLQLAASDQDENRTITEYLQYTLQETLPGLTVEIQLLPEKTLLDRKGNQEFDMLLTRQGPDFQDPTTFMNTYLSDSFNNTSSYQNAEYDALLAEAQAESVDLAARWQTLITAEQLLIEDAAVIPVYQSANTALLRSNIHGMIHHLFGPPNFYGKIMLD